MNYEFHVGDYVETVSGAKGYIDQVLSEGSYYFRWVTTDTDDIEFSNFCVSYCSDLSKYARIGQYDFTKNDKIERINYADNFICKRMKACDVAVILKNKINELVDAVNELEEQNKGCSGCLHFRDKKYKCELCARFGHMDHYVSNN